jgi:hypothetical protein
VAPTNICEVNIVNASRLANIGWRFCQIETFNKLKRKKTEH